MHFPEVAWACRNRKRNDIIQISGPGCGRVDRIGEPPYRYLQSIGHYHKCHNLVNGCLMTRYT
jgi:hypothetical protein